MVSSAGPDNLARTTMPLSRLARCCAVLLLSTLAGAAAGADTEIVVRAKARDAKFIGSSIGGALVRIREADSGRILAEGMTEGGTGNTELIMKTPRGRHAPIAQDAAAFKATLAIDKPVFLTVEVLAPYLNKQARTVSQVQTWLVPGKHIRGDGLVLEVPGMVVDVLGPQTHQSVSRTLSPLPIRANVVMMCGCPFTSGGTWNGDALEVAAIVTRNGSPAASVALKMSDTANLFAGALKADAPGNYQLTVYAYDPKTGNTGVDQMSFIVTD